MTKPQSAYIPGVCNINTKEIASRRLTGHVGLVLLLISVTFLIFTKHSLWFCLISFIPAFIMAIGYLQARQKFCVSYAMAGSQHADEDSANAQAVIDTLSKQADRRRARTIYLQSLVTALSITVIVCGLSYFI